MSRKITIALAGNPNSGKSTLFNRITGDRQHVGNYPGVTVERKDGLCRHGGVEIEVVDLPGTYSLTAYSVEELVARDFLVDEKPDVVVNIIDASNIERNLYLSVQLMELGVPLLLAFNMTDVAKLRGMEFDLERLSVLLGAPIVCTVGHKGQGVAELLDEVVAFVAQVERAPAAAIHYGPEIEEEIAKVEESLSAGGAAPDKYTPRWLALKLLEGDEEIRDVVTSAEALAAAERSRTHLKGVLGDSAEAVIAERRYGFISGACQETVRTTVEARHTVSDQIDKVLTNGIIGLPIFLGLMYLVFQLTFTLGEAPMGWIEGMFAWLGEGISGLWPKGSDSDLRSLLVDGIIGGVGGVIVFLPNIILLFLAVAFLEDSGYMARAAFVMDRLMHRIGLHGKSFIPMLIGFGCSVPAILATRTLESRRDRLTTMMVVPLMSCGARFPIYALIIPAFYPPAWRAPMLWLIYLIGILLAIVCAKVLRKTLLKGESQPFVMELPPYRMPTAHAVVVHMWTRSWLYLRKAGTIILGVSIIMWAMTNYPKKTSFDRDYDAEAEAAKVQYATAAKAVDAEFALSPDSDALRRIVEAELTLREVGKKHYEHEDAYKAAKVVCEDEIAKASAAGGASVKDFLKMRDKIVVINRAFKESTREIADQFKVLKNDLAAGDAKARAAFDKNEIVVEYREHEKRRDEQLAEAGAVAPAVHEAAKKYLKEAAKPYEKAVASLKAAKQAEELGYSIAGRAGHGMEPVLKPLGFDWKIGTALIGALAAKEVFVAQLGVVYSVGEADSRAGALRSKLREQYGADRLTPLCIMLFCLISAPCVATIAATKQESGSWRWAMLQLGGMTAMAYVITFVVYQVGSMLS